MGRCSRLGLRVNLVPVREWQSTIGGVYTCPIPILTVDRCDRYYLGNILDHKLRWNVQCSHSSLTLKRSVPSLFILPPFSVFEPNLEKWQIQWHRSHTIHLKVSMLEPTELEVSIRWIRIKILERESCTRRVHNVKPELRKARIMTCLSIRYRPSVCC